MDQGRTKNAPNEIPRRPVPHRNPQLQKPKVPFWSQWRAFFTIIISLLLGLAVALAHHFVNQYFDGKSVDRAPLSQSWVLRFGTGLAFLAKAAFVLSVGASYVQYQWLKLQSQAFRMDEIDSLTDILGNALNFVCSLVFFREPVVSLVAVVAWTIPFAAIVTPGSLTVMPQRTISTIDHHVPQPLWKSSQLGNTSEDGHSLQPSDTLYKLAYNTASAGQPVAITSDFQNETYRISFAGPALRCTSANESMVRDLTLQYGNGTTFGTFLNYQYFSWIPGTHQISLASSDESSSLDFFDTIDRSSHDVTRIYVLTNIYTGTQWNKTVRGRTSSNYTMSVVAVNVTECQLYNATYDVDYSFRYPNQTTEVSISSWLNPIPSIGWVFPPRLDHISYWSLMQAFGKILVGFSETNQYGSYTSYTSWKITDIDWSRAPAVQTGLESLFQNLTLSVLSRPEFLKSPSQADPVPVTITTYPITYTYAARDLVISYGLAFFFTLLCAIVGSYAFFVNGASYSNIFSSFLRATAGPDIRSILDANGTGADPLPGHLAGAKITIESSHGKLR